MSAIDFINAMWISTDAAEPDGVVDLTSSDSETDDEEIDKIDISDMDVFTEKEQTSLRIYVKIVACVAALGYIDRPPQFEESAWIQTWVDELEGLLDVTDINHPDKDAMVQQAMKSTMSFRNLLTSTTGVLGHKAFLTSVKEELLHNEDVIWTTDALYEYARNVLNPSLGEKVIKGIGTYMKNEFGLPL